MLRRADGSVRYFTVREGARIQTFPDEYSFRGAWSECMRQLGNAVPVRLARIVGESIASGLNGYAGTSTRRLGVITLRIAPPTWLTPAADSPSTSPS